MGMGDMGMGWDGVGWDEDDGRWEVEWTVR